MADDAARSRLGRGLAALMGDVNVEAQATERTRSQRRVPIEFVRANPRNPYFAFAAPNKSKCFRASAASGLLG